MSRPASRAAKGKKGKKEKPKPPKKIIAELTELNEQLTQELEKLKTEAEQMRSKIELVSKKIVDGSNRKELEKIYRINEQTDVFLLTTDVLLELLEKLVVRKQISNRSVESRVEELETRVTDMSLDIAKMTTKTMAYETGINKITKLHDIDDIKDKLYHLSLIAGQEYHTFTANDPVHIAQNFSPTVQNGVHDNPTRKSLESAQQLNLIPPAKKFSGETHICNMHKDLRLYVMKDLSIEKTSGADWRLLAERVGIPADLTAEWKSLRLQCPMGRVLAEWGESDGATVRMLHRHLISPQMRCTLLARRIADFYQVDFAV